MPFGSSAPAIHIELGATHDAADEGMRWVRGRLVVRATRAVAAQQVRVEFVGTEAVGVRAWVPPRATVTRTVAQGSAVVHGGGVLRAGTHEFAFSVGVPWWLPSSVEREACRIRYVVRGVVERGGWMPAAPTADAWTAETEMSCTRVRVARRLARRKRLDQSVGCPDGSCHVRMWGVLSRDVVKPGAALRLDLSARTSDARFGLRRLAASFTECLICSVQVKAEERVVNRISNLVTARLDALSDEPLSDDSLSDAASSDHIARAVEPPAEEQEPRSRGSLRSDPGQQSTDQHDSARQHAHDLPHSHLSRRLRKTRSRLAVLLRNGVDVPATAPPVPGSSATAPTTPQPRRADVARQIHASHVLHVPLGLSQFASEHVSREYRLIVVAEVAPLDDPESVHVNDAAATYGTAAPARPTRRDASPSSRSEALLVDAGAESSAESLSASAAADSPLRWDSPPERTHNQRRRRRRRRRRQSESAVAQQNPPHHWIVSEQSSAIAEWPVEVVDRFDVRFDELVSPEYTTRDHVRPARDPAPLRDPQVRSLEYVFVPESLTPSAPVAVAAHSDARLSPQPQLSPQLQPRTSPNSDTGPSHRRTSSGLVGFLKRGFRSSAPPPRSDSGSSGSAIVGAAGPASPSRHVRSVSGGSPAPANAGSIGGGSTNSPPARRRTGASQDGHIVMYPLQHPHSAQPRRNM
ncbi:hypothetical protein H4R24_005102 [Coemansia sp. RSA 988]|nr:hypothetical protein H4R24_005102 [Coemansia sp. RSA 988]